MRRVPRQRLHSDFLRALSASGHSVRTLATLAGFAVYTNLSPFLNRQPVRVSALNCGRLHKLAEIVGYDGPIFKEAR